MSQDIENGNSEEPIFKEGDILYAKTDKDYNVFKILKIDNYNDKFFCYHVLSYKPVQEMITLDEVENLDECRDDIDRSAYIMFCVLGGKYAFNCGVMVVYNPRWKRGAA